MSSMSSMELETLAWNMFRKGYSVEKNDEFSINVLKRRGVFNTYNTIEGSIVGMPTYENEKPTIAIGVIGLSSMPKSMVIAISDLYEETGGKFENTKFDVLDSQGKWYRPLKPLFSKVDYINGKLSID